MALPHAREARPFYRAAFHRFEEAQILVKAAKTTGAVYLCGYGVECILKSLILSQIANEESRTEMLARFRGQQAHNFDWLRARLHEITGRVFPREIQRAFVLVNSWNTSLRYQPVLLNPRDTQTFMREADTIIEWADGRL